MNRKAVTIKIWKHTNLSLKINKEQTFNNHVKNQINKEEPPIRSSLMKHTKQIK